MFPGMEPKALVYVGPAMAYGLTPLQNHVVQILTGQGI